MILFPLNLKMTTAQVQIETSVTDTVSVQRKVLSILFHTFKTTKNSIELTQFDSLNDNQYYRIL